jgi:hypothetical protein
MIYSKDNNNQTPTSISTSEPVNQEPITHLDSDGSDIFAEHNIQTNSQNNSAAGNNVAKVIKEIKELNEMIPKAKSSEELVEILKEISNISQELSHVPAIQYYLSITAVTYLEHRDKYLVINKRIQDNMQKLRVKDMYSASSNRTYSDIDEKKVSDISTIAAITRQGIVQMQKQIVAAKKENIINDILETNLFDILNNAQVVEQDIIKYHNSNKG